LPLVSVGRPSAWGWGGGASGWGGVGFGGGGDTRRGGSRQWRKPPWSKAMMGVIERHASCLANLRAATEGTRPISACAESRCVRVSRTASQPGHHERVVRIARRVDSEKPMIWKRRMARRSGAFCLEQSPSSTCFCHPSMCALKTTPRLPSCSCTNKKCLDPLRKESRGRCQKATRRIWRPRTPAPTERTNSPFPPQQRAPPAGVASRTWSDAVEARAP